MRVQFDARRKVAFDLISSRTALALADAYRRLAGEAPEAERPALVRRSFAQFEKFVEQMGNDRMRHASMRQMLLANYGRFGYLRPDVERMLAGPLAPEAQ